MRKTITGIVKSGGEGVYQACSEMLDMTYAGVITTAATALGVLLMAPLIVLTKPIVFFLSCDPGVSFREKISRVVSGGVMGVVNFSPRRTPHRFRYKWDNQHRKCERCGHRQWYWNCLKKWLHYPAMESRLYQRNLPKHITHPWTVGVGKPPVKTTEFCEEKDHEYRDAH